MQPPIADPNVTPQRHFDGNDVREFRVKLWPYFFSTWLATTLSVAGIVLLKIIFTTDGFPLPSVERTLFILALSAVAMLAMTAYIRHAFPIKVGKWGIRAVTFWTTPHQASWEQMSRVKFIWMAYPYAVVTCGNRQKLWVWLANENPREFARAVAAYTTPDHPLHAFLIGRGLLDSSSSIEADANAG